MITQSELISRALDARKRAYAKYSGFAVGAALLTSDGDVYLGCNVENVSFGLTICAERIAIGSAVQAGHTSFDMIAVVAGSQQPVVPCGACRQVLAEFNADMTIICANEHGESQLFSLKQLLPISRQGILS